MAKYKYKLNRAEIYRMICKKLCMKPSARVTLGYFDTKQMRVLLEYIEKTQGGQIVTDAGKSFSRVSAIRL
jgi:hypothetical protein